MKISTIIDTAAVVLFTTAAGAQPVPAQVRVSYADLNLNSVAGQANLAKRIDVAANAACGVDANERFLSLSAAAARCHSTAVEKARIDIASANAPVLASR